jgi:hypothetical protein
MEMRRMAESITGVSTIPADTVDPERMLSIQDAEILLGFDILGAAYLPPDSDPPFAFTYATFFERDISRFLLLAFSNNLHILVDFGPDLTSLEDEYNQAPQYYEKLTVRGQEALFSPGICWDENGNAFVQNCGNPQSLIWFENGLRYRIEGYMTQEMLIAIAEGMQ